MLERCEVEDADLHVRPPKKGCMLSPAVTRPVLSLQIRPMRFVKRLFDSIFALAR